MQRHEEPWQRHCRTPYISSISQEYLTGSMMTEMRQPADFVGGTRAGVSRHTVAHCTAVRSLRTRPDGTSQPGGTRCLVETAAARRRRAAALRRRAAALRRRAAALHKGEQRLDARSMAHEYNALWPLAVSERLEEGSHRWGGRHGVGLAIAFAESDSACHQAVAGRPGRTPGYAAAGASGCPQPHAHPHSPLQPRLPRTAHQEHAALAGGRTLVVELAQ